MHPHDDDTASISASAHTVKIESKKRIERSRPPASPEPAGGFWNQLAWLPQMPHGGYVQFTKNKVNCLSNIFSLNACCTFLFCHRPLFVLSFVLLFGSIFMLASYGVRTDSLTIKVCTSQTQSVTSSHRSMTLHLFFVSDRSLHYWKRVVFLQHQWNRHGNDPLLYHSLWTRWSFCEDGMYCLQKLHCFFLMIFLLTFLYFVYFFHV